jgi:hypothetical protein
MEGNGVSHQQDVTNSVTGKRASFGRGMKHETHETYNKRLKDWGALKQTYRHSLPSHIWVFRSIANIVQVAILNGESLFQLEYND